jgi:hypothetical protein
LILLHCSTLLLTISKSSEMPRNATFRYMCMNYYAYFHERQKQGRNFLSLRKKLLICFENWKVNQINSIKEPINVLQEMLCLTLRNFISTIKEAPEHIYLIKLEDR